MKWSILISIAFLILSFVPAKLNAQLTEEEELLYYKWWEDRGKEFGVAKQVFDQMLHDESLVKQDLSNMADALKAIDLLQKFAQAKDGEVVQGLILLVTEKVIEKELPGFNSWLGWMSWYKSALELLDKHYVTPERMKTQLERYADARLSGSSPDEAHAFTADYGQLLLEVKRVWIEKEGLNSKLIHDSDGNLHSAWQRRFERYYNSFFEEHYEKKLELEALKKKAKSDKESMQAEFERNMRRLLLDYNKKENTAEEEEREKEEGDQQKTERTIEKPQDDGNSEKTEEEQDNENDVAGEPEEERKAVKLIITPASKTIDINESVSLKVYLIYSDGSTEDVTAKVYSDPLFYPDKEGENVVVAEYNGLSATARFNVTGCADPNAKFEDGACRCKVGYTKDKNDNCQKEEEVFKSITLLPRTAETHIGGSVTLTVIGINAKGDAIDITSRVYDDNEFFADREGSFTVVAEYEGFSSSATINVKACNDPNAEFDYSIGECKCKKAYEPDDNGKCKPKDKEYSALSITPSDIEIEPGESVQFKAYATDSENNEQLDVTADAMSQSSFKAEKVGEYTFTASFKGLSAQAIVTVIKNCPDINMEIDGEGNCRCMSGYEPDGKGGCKEMEEEKEEEQDDSDCPDPNMERQDDGSCKCVAGFFPDPNNKAKCKSIQETKDEAENDAEEEDCVSFNDIKGKLNALKAQLMNAISNFNAHYARFQKEINDNKSDPCKNQMIAYSYSRAKIEAQKVTEIRNKALAEYATLFLFTSKCSDFDADMNAAGFDKAAIENIGNEISLLNTDMGDISSRIDEEGCDENDLDELGQQVATDPDADPELTSDGGTGTEIQGDGKDNDGEGQQDEIPVSAIPGYNVTIVIYDSGSAKDDVFSLTVSDVGYQGITPAGGLMSFPLNLTPKSYTATVKVVSAPDNIGTFTINVLFNGSSIGSMTGDPGEGAAQTLNFTIPN